ncbi:UDP-glucose--hexose-1-phosphate uridylyltransferase [Ruminococcus sp.]|uniref:UDP-glucose--hexose-1-phosphate uridylyltransferase n=1 Tax=Ruminococcus sp. TaxID=41978 RepID=UPI0025F789AB|nr:UDP-glucose--hexose-1-phosphate uridylyltransferase [Ruminococcus sp.]MBD9050058.1 UDP-glucose--hexose-1-phosphate uridylyltransferase [Ruminococcus sp.]
MICNEIQKLINYSIKSGLIEKEDEYVIRNQLMDALCVYDWDEPEVMENNFVIDDILDRLTDYACENKIIDDTTASRDLFDTKLMGIVTPFPREIIGKFNQLCLQSPEKATDWYYDISQKLNYVRAGRIAKDIRWQYESEYGTLDITTNRSKPEKDPRDIAAARTAKATAYPKCQLCPENAGFAGNKNHPARQNLRPIPIDICGESWQLQYSPYGYYNEHCIVFNEKHIPMKIDSAVFEKLFDFIDKFPHYFVGSNADLPIVGGSILSHEHFQGGNYTFAMAKAEIEKEFSLSDFPEVTAGIVKWPMSVIRIKSKNRFTLSKACSYVLEKWRGYSDPNAGIFAETEGVPHNTVTPIARMNGDNYECDLVLRNNITSDERPLGVFHPNQSLHHIKKENIGLIEVMGLAVLPARLAVELEEVKKAMLSGADLNSNPATASHARWAKNILLRYPEFPEANAEDILRLEVGKVFEQVLCDAGVFKRTEKGISDFIRFTEVL